MRRRYDPVGLFEAFRPTYTFNMERISRFALIEKASLILPAGNEDARIELVVDGKPVTVSEDRTARNSICWIRRAGPEGTVVLERTPTPEHPLSFRELVQEICDQFGWEPGPFYHL